MSSFSERYDQLQQDLAKVLQGCCRPADGAKILAVSKTFPNEAILEAYECGVRAFGENKVQELSAKAESLPADIGDQRFLTCLFQITRKKVSFNHTGICKKFECVIISKGLI